MKTVSEIVFLLCVLSTTGAVAMIAKPESLSCEEGFELRPNVSYSRAHYGCGEGAITPQQTPFFAAAITNCCNRHTDCYSQCQVGLNKTLCDQNLGKCFGNACDIHWCDLDMRAHIEVALKTKLRIDSYERVQRGAFQCVRKRSKRNVPQSRIACPPMC